MPERIHSLPIQTTTEGCAEGQTYSRWIGKFSWLLILSTAFILGGCAGYQMGTPTTTEYSSVYIPPVENNAYVPQADALMLTAVREAFLRGGRIQLKDGQSADTTLEIELVRYEREGFAARPEDSGLDLSYDLELMARITLTDNRTGREYLKDVPVTADAQVVARETLTLAEQQALPVLTRRLAAAIHDRVTQTW